MTTHVFEVERSVVRVSGDYGPPGSESFGVAWAALFDQVDELTRPAMGDNPSRDKVAKHIAKVAFIVTTILATIESRKARADNERRD